MRRYRKAQVILIKENEAKHVSQREVMQSLSLEFLNPRLDKALNNWLDLTADSILSRRLNRIILYGPFKTKLSCDSMNPEVFQRGKDQITSNFCRSVAHSNPGITKMDPKK